MGIIDLGKRVQRNAWRIPGIGQVLEIDYAPLFWLKGLLDARSFVFDLGGHIGVAYHAWRNYLNYPRGMRWLVQDVPAIVKVGAEIARERSSEGLEFTSNIPDCSEKVWNPTVGYAA